MITLLSYNIELGKRIAPIYNWIQSLSRLPDIFCFQEFPVVAIETLHGIIGSKYQSIFVSSIVKRKRVYGQLTLYNSGRFQLKNSRVIHLPRGLGESKIFLRNVHRRSLTTQFTTRKNKTFTLSNVHLVFAGSNALRLHQLKSIVRTEKDNRHLVVGDYNYTSRLSNRPLFKTMATYGFTSALSGPTHRLLGVPQQLDYVFYKNIAAVTAKILAPRFSDHLPIMVQFKLDKRERNN